MPKQKKKKPQVAGTAAESGPPAEEPQPAEPQATASDAGGGGKGKGKKGKGPQQVFAEPAPPQKKAPQRKEPTTPAGGDASAAEDVSAPPQAGRDTSAVRKQKGKESTPPLEVQLEKKLQIAGTAAESGPPAREPQPAGPQATASDAGGGGKGKGKGKKGKGAPQVFAEPAPPQKKGTAPQEKRPTIPVGGDVPAPSQAGSDTGAIRQHKGKEATPPAELQLGPPPRTAWGQPRGPSTPSEQQGPPPSRGPIQQGPPLPRVPAPQVVQAPMPHLPRGPALQVAQAPTPRVPPGFPQPSVAQEAPQFTSPPAVTRTQRDDTELRQRQATAPQKSFALPTRHNINKGGSAGKPIVVDTNHLALDLSRLRTKIAYHYDVTVDPDKPKRMIRFAVEEFRKKHYPDRFPAFDGRKNLVSAAMLPFGQSISGSVDVMDEERQATKSFTVTIQYVARVDLSSLQQYMRAGSSLDAPQTAIQMVDIVLRNAASLKFVPVGRSHFSPPSGHIVHLGEGMEMWVGLYQSVNLGWRPFVNVDVVHKAFPTHQSLLDTIVDVCSDRYYGQADINRPLGPQQIQNLRSFIAKLKVDYMIPNQPQTKRTFRVNDVAGPANEVTFKQDDGKLILVADYFRTTKKVALQYPHLPCLHVGSLNRPSPILLPVEFCTVTKGQATRRAMNERQTAELVKRAATSTQERKKKIFDALRRMNFNQDPAVREFGLTVNESFSKVPARILPAPQLAYKDERPVNPVKGVWRAAEFLKSQSLQNWAIVSLDRRTKEGQLWDIHKNWVSASRSLGMTIEQPVQVKSMRNPSRTERDFRQAKEDLRAFFQQNKNLQLIVVVVPDSGDTYANVKQVAELNVGVLTQCIKSKTVSRMNLSTAANLLLKVNSKLNGVNHQLSRSVRPKCLQTPAILVGADVTHPSPDKTDIPSVAAVCASHDPNGFRYNIQFRLQPPRTEIIQDLENIMRHHLMFFYNQTNQKPARILFFRDGVSEGEFVKVLNAELTAIRKACLSLNENYRPAITFLVVQKRHHTRFFPTRREDEDGKNCNVPAGTIVDTEITHPTEIDFYLVSHASIQGVSRPTKYHCLWDDSKMSDDELQQLTYFLCHMFSRCTRSVSYPAPTYYAHLAAYRARMYIEGSQIHLDSLENEQKLRTIKEDFIKNSPMFFV